ncbi:unnamed protein product [Blepharisma stoltei]|uniref:Protein-tyrosine-phosphatase n=1 Tax=Blepharisma stoltei TaxID=1481888 RepID=A0AAU9I731_9CILI|nr:unnamed protein product [Blepharisma stoltei]
MYLLDEIEDGLYLGDKEQASQLNLLFKFKITHILIAGTGSGLEPYFSSRFVYKQLPIVDCPSFDILNYFDEATEFIEEAINSGGRVMVHCAQGISRSASIVIAYIMKQRCWNFRKAKLFVQYLHPPTKPNRGFAKQLEIYSRILSIREPASTTKRNASCACTLF